MVRKPSSDVLRKFGLNYAEKYGYTMDKDGHITTQRGVTYRDILDLGKQLLKIGYIRKVGTRWRAIDKLDNKEIFLEKSNQISIF